MGNLKVSMKLLVGFGVMVALIITISLISIFNLLGIDDTYSIVIQNHAMPLNPAINVVGDIQAMRSETRNCVIFSGNKEKVRDSKLALERLMSEFEDSAASFAKSIVNPEVKGKYDEAFKQYKEIYKPGALKIVAEAEKGAPAAEMIAHLDAIKTASEVITDNMIYATDVKAGQLASSSEESTAHSRNIVAMMVVILIAGIVIAVFFGIYISSMISKPLSTTVNMINEMAGGRLDMRLRLAREDEIGVMAKTMDNFADTLQALIIDDGGRVLTAAANKDMSQRMTHDYKGAFGKMKENINTVVQTLDTALSQVSEAVGQVTSASGQISSGAQSLAEGANTQASSLEEVSSSLEEMSSMTKQNADNSNQAKLLAGEARVAANSGDASMKKMAEAINQIKASADNTAKIIKSIDDIAFQTNLLALNAAVEAARAGEAGKGFAVVAEEVRNLAMRSAEAARNTADMIEASVKNAEGGVKITEEVAEALSQIVDRAGKVGDLIAEIAAASNEQALGIEQVNTAVASMNQVTQQNAANSEESASASEELSSQAAELANMVNEFKLSVGNSGGMGARRSLPPPRPQQRPAVAALPNKSATATAIASKSAKAVKSSEVIPLDDDELGEF